MNAKPLANNAMLNGSLTSAGGLPLGGVLAWLKLIAESLKASLYIWPPLSPKTVL